MTAVSMSTLGACVLIMACAHPTHPTKNVTPVPVPATTTDSAEIDLLLRGRWRKVSRTTMDGVTKPDGGDWIFGSTGLQWVGPMGGGNDATWICRWTREGRNLTVECDVPVDRWRGTEHYTSIYRIDAWTNGSFTLFVYAGSMVEKWVRP